MGRKSPNKQTRKIKVLFSFFLTFPRYSQPNMRKDPLSHLYWQVKIKEVLIFNDLFINHTQNTDNGEKCGVNKHSRHEQEFI